MGDIALLVGALAIFGLQVRKPFHSGAHKSAHKGRNFTVRHVSRFPGVLHPRRGVALPGHEELFESTSYHYQTIADAHLVSAACYIFVQMLFC